MSNSQPGLQRLAEVRRLYKSGEAKRIRTRASVSQSDFARSLGTSRAAVCLWESGRRSPRHEVALRCWSLLQILKDATPTTYPSPDEAD